MAKKIAITIKAPFIASLIKKARRTDVVDIYEALTPAQARAAIEEDSENLISTTSEALVKAGDNETAQGNAIVNMLDKARLLTFKTVAKKIAKAEKPAKAAKAEKAEKHAKAAKAEKAEKHAKAAKSEKAEKPAKAAKAEKAEKHAKADKPKKVKNKKV